VGCDLGAPLDLGAAQLDPAADVLFVVAAGGEARRLDLVGGRQQEDDDGIGALAQDLFGPLHVDLEKDDVGTRRRVGDRCALEVIEERRPLEEAAGLDRRLEGGAVDEDVRTAFLFTRARRARRPAAAQPDGGVAGNELRRNRALAGPTGTDEDEDVRLARGGFSAQSL
jgi:hypothetical protein